ncbi:hypothetical protein Trydic_g50 [Trypoxylus dichotomus]
MDRVYVNSSPTGVVPEHQRLEPDTVHGPQRSLVRKEHHIPKRRRSGATHGPDPKNSNTILRPSGRPLEPTRVGVPAIPPQDPSEKTFGKTRHENLLHRRKDTASPTKIPKRIRFYLKDNTTVNGIRSSERCMESGVPQANDIAIMATVRHADISIGLAQADTVEVLVDTRISRSTRGRRKQLGLPENL